jgi:GAF domain-containing protein
MCYNNNMNRSKAILENLSQASQAITASLELDQMLAEIVSLAGEVAASDYANVVLVDTQGRLGRSVDLPDVPTIDQPTIRTEGFTHWIVRSRQAVVVDNIDVDGTVSPRPSSEAPCTANPLVVKAGVKSFLGLPLVAKDRLLGVLFLHSLRPNNFCGQLPLLTPFANQAAMAIENARLYQIEQKRSVQLAVVNQVARQTASILDLDQLLQEVVTAIQQSFNYYHLGLFLLDEIVGELELRAIAGGFVDVVPPDHHLALGEGIAGWVAQTGKPFLANDVSQEPRYVLGFLEEPLAKAELCVPLKLAGQVIGVLDIQSTQLNAFDETDLLAMETMADQIAIAIENALLFRETKHRFEETMALYQTSLDITAQLEMPELLKSIVERAITLLRAEAGGIYMYNPERGYLRWAVSYGYTEKYVGVTLKPGEGMAGKVFQTGEPLIVDDYRTWEGRAPAYEADQPFTAVLGVPLKWQDRIIGVLSINANAQQRTFNQNDLWLATLFANQAALAIENARIYEKERKRLAQLELIGGVIQKIASILNLDELLYQVAHLIGDTFQYYYTSILLVEANTGELLLKAVAGPFFETLLDRLRLKIGQEGITGWVAHTGEPLLVNDVSREPRYYSPIEESKYTRSELAVPIKLKGEIIGVLDVQSVELDAFSQDDVFILQTLADQLAVAIESARLYQETVRQLEEAETLSAMTTALTRSLDLDQVLQSIVDSATRLIPASTSGVIHLADEATGKLIPRATSLEAKIQENMGMPIGKGIAGLVMQEKRLINVPNVEKDPRFIQLDTGTPKKSLLTAPLLIERECIGTLSLNSDQVGAFSADDERLLTTLAAQAAIAVRNARLYQEVHRRVEELIFLNRVGRAVTSSLDLEQILTTVLEETARVLRTEAGSILLLDEESSELVFEAAVGPRPSEEMKGLRSPLGQGIAGWVAREGQRLLVPDVREDPRFYPGIDEATGFVTRSVLAVPLKVKGKVIGVIEAVNKTEGNFTQADVALLASMAQWAAIAIENAQLFAETRQRFEEMAALHDTSLDITARLEMPELLKSIVERAVGLLRADTGGVYLYDHEQKALRLAIGYDYTEKYVGATLKPGEGMAGKVFQSGEPMMVDDYRTWGGRAAVFEADQPFSAALQVPLKWQERTLGVLAIDANAERRTFKQDDVWLATLFANQAVIAIENARLYEELQNRIEELKRTQAQLIQSAKLAAIGELAAGVAHEINNPLTSIVGFTRLLLQRVDEDDLMKEDLQIIDREAARTKAIVRALLDFARQREPRLESADVNEIVRTTMTLVRHQAKGARVTVKECYDENLPPVSLDADQIKQVFLNMMTNAIQAMPKGGELKVVTAYRPQARSPDGSTGSPQRLFEGMDSADYVVVEFHDTGTGISAENLLRIFDPFFTTKEVGQGTGLGLSISQGIVERHGGKIKVESEVGRGSIFTVMLPVTQGQRAVP